MKTVAMLVAVVGALTLQTTMSGFMVRGASAVNLVVVAVIYIALAYGPVTGLLAGTVGGLAQDALGGGIVGLGGLSKTLIGFLVGVLGAQFIVSTTVARLVMFIAASMLHEVVFEALHALVEGRRMALHLSPMVIQALVNGLVGVTAFLLVERGPDVVQRRRMRRAATLSKRRF